MSTVAGAPCPRSSSGVTRANYVDRFLASGETGSSRVLRPRERYEARSASKLNEFTLTTVTAELFPALARLARENAWRWFA